MNIVQEYINYIEKKYKKILSLALGTDYIAKTVTMFIKEYINVRYYEEHDLEIENLHDVIVEKLTDLKELLSSKKSDNCLENIIEVFELIFYIDKVDYSISINEIFKNINLTNQKEIIRIMREVDDKRNKYLQLADNKKFYIELHTLNSSKKIKSVKLKHDVKFSKLYSDYAIEKVYNSGIISEDKLFIEYTHISFLILNDRLSNQEIGHYILEFSDDLLKKEQKLYRVIKVINNELVKSHVSLKVNYSDYLNNKEKIEELIKNGINITAVIDNSFKCDKIHIEELIVFKNIIIDMKYFNYDYIKENKESIRTNVLDATLVI